MVLIDSVYDASFIIHYQTLIIDDFQEEIKGLKKDESPVVIAEAKARGAKLVQQLNDAKMCLANLARQLKEIWNNNQTTEDNLLQLIEESDLMRVYNSELGKQVVTTNEHTWEVKDALKVE